MVALWYAEPSRAEMLAMEREIWLHKMGAQNLRQWDRNPSTSDRYAYYLNPDNFPTLGGYLRDRPPPRDPDVSIADNYNLPMLATELAYMPTCVNGWVLDILGWPGGTTADQIQNWQYCKDVMTAVLNVNDGRKVMLMPDCSNFISRSVMVDGLKQLIQIGSSKKDHLGRTIISPYLTDKATSLGYDNTYWTNVLSDLAALGLPCSFVPCVQENFASQLTTRAPISYGIGIWGGGSPASNNADATGTDSPKGRIAAAHATNGVDGQPLKWFAPVRLQDARPRSTVYDEACNTELLFASFRVAREGGADWVQVVTDNDWGETSAFAPSVHHGFVALDLLGFHGIWYKTGVRPTILKDTVIVSHRKHKAGASWSYARQTVAPKLRTGSTPTRDTIEALAFTRDDLPGTPYVHIKTTTTSSREVAGPVFAMTAPLVSGSVRAEITRSGKVTASVTSPFTVVDVPLVPDYQYAFADSWRQGFTAPDEPEVPEPAAPGSRWVGRADVDRWRG